MRKEMSVFLQALEAADAVVLGAGAGLSTAAGYTYTGARFERYFSDFSKKYGFSDMYSGGFCPFGTPEERWAYWSRYIWINRYADTPGTTYDDLFSLVKDRDYFVLTTNVDHCFQRAGFAKERLFYTQGDYGLFQCEKPCRGETWDNEDAVLGMVRAQGYTIGGKNELIPPAGSPKMEIPSELVPRCPHCGRPASMNLRADDTFVEDDGWRLAAGRYDAFMKAHDRGRVLYLEIGVGYNTPGIVKYNFWNRVYANPEALYVCLNPAKEPVPEEIAPRSLAVGGDTAAFLREAAALSGR